MVTVPTPYDASTGAKISASAFDAGVRDALTFLLTGFPRVWAYDTTGVSCPDVAVGTLMTFDSENYDTDTMHSTSSNTGRITFTTAGLYNVNARITMPGFTYSTLNFRVSLNSGGAFGGGTTLWTQGFQVAAAGNGNCHANFDRFFSAGDYIECFIAQTSGAARTTSVASGAFANRVMARWLATV